MSRSPFEYKQAIILRVDLGMSMGKLISQACHACLGAVEEAKKTRHEAWRRWRDEGAKKVILKVESLEELLELVAKAEEQDIPHALIEDRGLTEVPPGTVTALGVGPEKSELVDRVTGGLKLL
ncbi:MAG: peptidyl-tRNA hydrolase Pth2 [Candidatus Bathyarchaeia archaeon]